MPGKTTYLQLVLPELNEFLNSWHTPVNQNMEDIDDWMSDLYQSLVGASSSSTWAGIRGSMDSLAERLDVSINADGTVDLSSAEEIQNLATSRVDGAQASIDERFAFSDLENYAARPGFSSDRFSTGSVTIPTASGDYPRAKFEVGTAWRARDFGAGSGNPLGSPRKPWAPGLVSGNPTLFNPVANGVIELQGGTTPAIFNIDGYLFRIREDITLDLSNLSGIADGNYVWLFVERRDYDNSTYIYASGAKDLRRLQEGSADGSTSGSTFSSPSATFTTPPIGAVKPGDLLVIDSGTAAGEYVVDVVDSATQLTIKGEFPANVSGLDWHVQDDNHPNFGGVPVSGASTMPSYVEGRVYIGRCLYPNSSSYPSDVITFPANGVYDTGWVTAAASGVLTAPWVSNHNLGTVPSQIEVWVRESSGTTIYQPMLERTLDSTDVSVPSLKAQATLTTVTIRAIDSGALFTVPGGADNTDGDIRVIVRR